MLEDTKYSSKNPSICIHINFDAPVGYSARSVEHIVKVPSPHPGALP